jgi:putative PEP-CTERM system TPR-repeat lipoprotein
MRIVRLTPPRRGALFLALPALVLIGGAFVAPTTATANIEDAKSYFAAAQKELHGGNLRAAEIELRNAVEADPNNTAIRIELADVYLKLRNFPAAEIEARVALQKGGNRNQAEPILAESLFRQRRFNQLFKEVKPAHLNPAAESHVRMDLGLAHLNLGEMAEAEPLLREAEKLDPTGAGPKIAIAQLLLAKKDLKGAQSEADAAVGIAPNNPDVLRLDGEILRREGNEAGALSLFNQILAKNPNHIPTLVSRADLYIAKKNLAAAKGDVDRVLKIAPKNRFAIYLSALIEAKTGKFQAADQTLQQDAAEMEENPGYLYLSGAVKYALHQYVLADTDLTKFVAREPRNGAGWRLLGLTALAEHDFGKVIRVLKSYTDATPSDRVAVSALGRAYMASGASDKAIELFQRVANAEPSDPGAQMQLAFTRLQSGETDRAVGELENIVRTSAGAKMAGPLLAMIDLRKGDVAAAAATAEKLVSLNGKAPVALTTLALVRFAQGNYAEAAKILTGVIQKAPKFLTAAL